MSITSIWASRHFLPLMKSWENCFRLRRRSRCAMRNALAALTLGWLVVLTPAACSSQGGNSVGRETKLRQRWAASLKDGYERSSLDEIVAVDPQLGTVSGFRLWRGEYRGVPIALYSCAYSKPFGGELGWIRVVLAMEEAGAPLPAVHPNYTGPFVARAVVREVAEHKYPPADIAVTTILRDPRHGNTWSIGQVTVEIRDKGDGRLDFKINATKKPGWATFDLEQVLKGANLSGPREIKPLPFKQYSPKEFGKAMVSILKTFKVTADPWWQSKPSSSEMSAVDHPMWADPSAVKGLLTTAPTKELVHAINFMERRSWRDSTYLRRLESIDSTLMGLGNHESAEVRGAFGMLLNSTLLWPGNVGKVAPLLASTDVEVQAAALAAFAFRGDVPRDLQRVRELAKSKDSQVRFEAERVLRLGNHR